MSNRLDLVLSFFEKQFIRLLLVLMTVFSIGIHYITFHQPILVWFNNWLTVNSGTELNNIQGTLQTIASIFIGIYFTVFTLLTTLTKDASLIKLTQDNFNKLVHYIRNAFLGAFAYIVLSLVASLFVTHPDKQHYFYFNLIQVLLGVYMILSAFRLGFIYYIAYKKDLENIQRNVTEEIQEEQHHRYLMHRIERVITDIENEKEQRQAERVREINRTRRFGEED